MVHNLLNLIMNHQQNDCSPFHFTSSSYAKHGKIAVKMPLANCSICGPDSSTNSRIQSIAVNCMIVFVDWAWLIKMLHISDIRVPAGSLLIAFRNSDKSVSQLEQVTGEKKQENNDCQCQNILW